MKEEICRFCLQTIRNGNCRAVEESLLKSLKLNINISKGNVMCIECASCLQVFSSFTSGCVSVGDGALPLSDFQNVVELHPLQIEATSNSNLLVKTEMKCSFCTEPHNGEDLISLKESKENKFMVNMLEQHISEMNLKGTEELLTCVTCLKALQGSVGVILKCLEVEKKISKYIELEGTGDKGQVELKKVQFMFGPVIKLEIESFGVNELGDRSYQVPEENTMMAEFEIKYEKEIRNMELIIKTESEQITEIKLEQSDCDRFQEPFIENNTPDDPLHNMSVVMPETGKSKESIKQRLRKMFHCETCPYMTKHRGHFNDHLLTHKSPSEVTMFKCESCSYETKQKSNLKDHLLTHKTPSEIKMYKCEFCSYEAKRKNSLGLHLLTHKSPPELKMFKCELCSYETKRKNHLGRHLLTHKSPSELKMFKCEMCSYEAKQKGDLRQHLLTHKSRLEIKMFKCDSCSYEAKRKSGLKRHLFTHKREIFKCELCSYQTKQKSSLKLHLLTHKSPPEIEMFKCALCSYEAKQKSHLKSHLLTHKSPSEIEMFKCELCSYEAKQKKHLKSHLLTHESSEVNMFKCELCSYEAKRKYDLKRHLFTHRNPAEVKKRLNMKSANTR